MTEADIAGVFLGVFGIVATAVVGVLFYIMTAKVLRRMNSMLIARMSLAEYRQALRLLDDIEKTGQKRGTIAQRADGTWAIDWTPGGAPKANV